MMKLLMIIFTENSNIGASLLCSLSRKYDWETDIHFIPPITSDYSNIIENIKNYNANIISFSFKSFEREQALHIAKLLKDIPSIKIAGGIHPTLMSDEIKETALFDAIVVGDGLGIWKDILNSYEKLNNTIIYGKQHSDIKMYTEEFYSKSQIKRMKSTKTATVLTSIGCPYKCTFCHSGHQDYTPLPIKDVAQHIIELNIKYGVQNFHFLDDTFASNLKRLHEFRETIEQSNTKSNIRFSSQVSAKANIFNEEIADELIKLGVETVNFGIETASPKLTKFLNKKQTLKNCYDSIKICHEKQLNCVVNLMFGIPTQNEEDYKLTLEFIKKSKPDSVNTFFYTPYPGTELYNYCFKHNYLPETYDKNKFDWFKPNLLGTSEIQIKLKNVDYELAKRYIEEIQQTLNQDDNLFRRLEIIDNYKWILIGTTRHYYYLTLINKLSKHKWKNFCGYINMDKESGFYINNSMTKTFPEYNNNTSPEICITYSFIGSDFELVKHYVKNKFANNPPLISVSSFKKSHSTEDINKIIKSMLPCQL